MMLLITALLLFVGVGTTHAVIPELMGPLQSLIALLPQLLVAAAVGIGAVFSVRGWRTRIAACGAYLSQHKAGSIVGVVVVGGVVASVVLVLDRRAAPGVSAPPHPVAHVAAAAGESWPTFRGDMWRSGNPSASAGPAARHDPARFGEQALDDARLYSSPSVVGDRLYVGAARGILSRHGVVYCLNATDGAELWSFRTTYQIASSPVVAGGHVYIGEGLHEDTGARLYCLNAGGGDFVWDFPTASHVESTPTVANGRVFFGAGDDGVYCLDAASGEQIWHTPGLHVDVSPAVVDRIVLVGTGYGDMGVYALDLDTGDVLWTVSTECGVWGSPSVHAGRAYFGIGAADLSTSGPATNGGLLCVDIARRTEAWTYDAKGAVLGAVAVAGSTVYFGSRDWHLYAVDATDGSFRWRYDAGAPVVASPAVAQDLVYAASEDGEVAAIDRVTGEPRWQVYLTGVGQSDLRVLASPAIRGGQLFVGAWKGGMFVIGDPGST